MTLFGEKYADAFWPLAVFPLAVAGVGVVVAVHFSPLAVVALGALATAAALAEVVIWRGLRAKWSGEIDNLWPWSQRLRIAVEVTAAASVMVAAGSLKVHDIQGGDWPAAVVFSALTFGGLAAFILVVSAVERYVKARR